ncbi:chorismate--pyruvate lyase family protein [Isoalcanivorax indicus]|uniref:chorismate--pyruvate lyase family protein n=1 Tax=Isoalcanivorax indicus TaxID=2202653 RepID=UPI001FEB4E4C|nr:chorismate lyase [Isoalcanivorax indicus]
MRQFAPHPWFACDQPRWQPLARVRAPAPMADWLADTGSLTHRLRQLGQFSVLPLRQRIAAPAPQEARLLQQPPRHAALIREVCLHVDGVPVVYARSVLPLTSLTGANRVLGHMARRSLGAELFRRPRARRCAVWAATFPPGALPVAAGDTPVWGRQSLFRKRGKPLLVAEVFLPALWPLSDHAARS